MPELDETSQLRFHRRWSHLQDSHVRALAWLLDSSDLLDSRAFCWQGKIATLDSNVTAIHDWLSALDCAPEPLHAFLLIPGTARLGRYAEKLMAWYFRWCGTLVAHGLQVQAERNDTIGEFDFLLQEDGKLVHYEFATKFYLFELRSAQSSGPGGNFLGPNLADTLSAKMQKILCRQLALGQHPAAQKYLSQPVTRAQALIKGWLFYHDDSHAMAIAPGVAAGHCRGFWCSLTDFNAQQAEGFLALPRLSWLAPAQVVATSVMDGAAMRAHLAAHFEHDPMPVLVALMHSQAGYAREVSRGFVVPDDWRQRAHEWGQRTVLQVQA